MFRKFVLRPGKKLGNVRELLFRYWVGMLILNRNSCAYLASGGRVNLGNKWGNIRPQKKKSLLSSAP